MAANHVAYRIQNVIRTGTYYVPVLFDAAPSFYKTERNRSAEIMINKFILNVDVGTFTLPVLTVTEAHYNFCVNSLYGTYCIRRMYMI